MRMSSVHFLFLLFCALPFCCFAEEKIQIKDVVSLMDDAGKKVALGCEAIYSSSFESEDIDRIQVLANEYDIAPLHDIVNLRKARQLDAGNKLENIALEALLKKIEKKHKSNISYEEVYVRLVQGMLCHIESVRADLFSVANEGAQKLLENEMGNILYQELVHVSTLLYIANSSNIHGPTKYKEFKLSLLELLNMYEQNDIHGFLRQESGAFIVDYISYLENEGYSDYCKFVDNRLKEEIGVAYQDITMEGLLLSRKEEALLRKDANHPDILFAEADLGLNTIIYSNNQRKASGILDKLFDLYTQSYDYFGADSYIVNYLGLHHSLYSIFIGEKSPEFTDEMRKELAAMQKAAGDDKVLLLEVLCKVLGVFINVSPEVSTEIYREIETVAEKIRPIDEYGYFTALSNKLYLQRSSVSGYDFAAEEMKHLLNEYGQDKKDWLFIKMAQCLLHSLLDLYGETAETLELNQIVYDAEMQLLNGEKELSVFSGINYANIKGGGSFAVLDDDSFEQFLVELEKEAIKYGINASDVLLANAVQSLNRGDQNKAMDLLRKAIYDNSDVEKSIELYSVWIDYIADMKSADKETTLLCVEHLDSLFEAEYGELKVEHMYGYFALAQYYANRNDLPHSHRILQRCFEYYHNESIVPDSYYTMFANAMFHLYMIGYGSFEQCRLLLNSIQQKIDKVKAFVGFESYLGLLRNCYDLVEIKSPTDYALLFSYLLPLFQAYSEYFYVNNNSEDVAWAHLPYLLVKISNIYRGLRIMNDHNASVIYEQMRNNKQFELFINRANDMCKKAGPHIKSSDNYYNLLMGLGQMYEYLIDDQSQADFYYREMRELNKNHGEIWYMGYLVRRGNWEEALHIAETVRADIDEAIEIMRQNGHIGSFSEEVAMLFAVYFKNGHYDIASYYASLYMHTRMDVIDNNFDYYTTQERESFIMHGGAGSAPIFALLANMDGDITEKAYNAALQEKGLLLRSSERVSNAVKNSGNRRLIESMDSIQILTQSFLAIKDDVNMNEETMRYASYLRSKIDELEHYVSEQTAKYRDGFETVPSWEEVRDALKKGEVAIEFVPGDSAIHALIIAPHCQRPQKVTVLNNEDLSNISDYLNDQSNITERMKLLYDNEAKNLYHAIWEPLIPYVGNAKTVFYSPVGVLCALSFNALQLDDNSYLIDHYELRQLTTTANIVRRNMKDKNPKKITSAIVAGGLCYEEMQLSFINDEVNWAKRNSSPIVAQREALQNFEFLPFSYIEKDNIISTLRKIGVVTIEKSLMDATETCIRESLEETRPEIIHISTHGFSYPNEKQASEIPYLVNNGQLTALNTAGIALSDANLAWEGEKMPKETDNILTADEISVLDLRETRLAVLSACNTALGSTSSEGVMGLQRGLKQAGVETLCMTLWNVNDATSSSLMSMFYENWLDSKMSTSKAMRTAMKRQRSLTPSPYFWAPFILIDDLQ